MILKNAILWAIKKTIHQQKNNIKRLMCDNDSLRRVISRVNGIRKFTGNVQNATHGLARELAGKEKMVADTETSLSKLRESVANVATSLIDTLDSCSTQDTDFTKVTHNRSKTSHKDTSDRIVQGPPALTYRQSVLCPPPSAGHPNESLPLPTVTQQWLPATAPASNWCPPRPSSTGQPIPVVQLGHGRQQPSAAGPSDIPSSVDIMGQGQPHRHQRVDSNSTPLPLVSAEMLSLVGH